MTATVRMTREQMAGRRLKLLRKIRDEMGPSPDGALERDIAAAETILGDATVAAFARPVPVFRRARLGMATAAAMAAIALGGLLTTDTEARRHPAAPCAFDEPQACSGGWDEPFYETPLPWPEAYAPADPPFLEARRAAPRRYWRRWTAPRMIAKAPPPATIAAYAVKIYGDPKGVTLRGVTPPLAAVARRIGAECGSVVSSAKVGRETSRTCSRRTGLCSVSNHALGYAVDMTKNPKCIYALLAKIKFPGGVSTDYDEVRCGGVKCPHVHISHNRGGKEWGRKFVHDGSYPTRFRMVRRVARVARAGG